MPNFNFDLVDQALDDKNSKSKKLAASSNNAGPPTTDSSSLTYLQHRQPSQAQRRLEALKQQIADELLAEKRLREIEQSKPRLDPLSLAPANEAKKARQPTALDHSFHVLVQSLKLDSWVQKELEMELDRKSQEMDALQSQNDRLREIISLRQEANQRKEDALQDELDRLRSVTRRAAPEDLTSAMDELREMKELVNAGADTLYDTLKQRAIAERLALVRTFTVRIREVQNLVEQQRQENTEGAQEWIDRYGTLEREHEITTTEANYLRTEVVSLKGEVDAFEDVSRDRKDKFEVLIDELSSLKADNRRLEEHCNRIQKQIWETKARTSGLVDQQQQISPPSSRPQSGLSSNPSPANSRPTSAAATKPPRAPSAQPRQHHHQVQQQQEITRGAKNNDNSSKPERGYSGNAASNEEKAQTALRRLKTTLESMKKKIRIVRAAHIEHLQERTELELFLRQCVDDVRKDLERASSTDVHLRFSPEEKQRVVDILSAKLRVLTALHKRTFPNKLSPLMDANFPVDIVMFGDGGSDSRQPQPHSSHREQTNHDDNSNNNNEFEEAKEGQEENVQVPNSGVRSSSRVDLGADSSRSKIRQSSHRSITPLQQQAPYQLPHRSSSAAGNRSKPPRPDSSSSSVQQQQQNRYGFSNAARNTKGGSSPLQPPQQQDELMDSLWTKWQDWNAKISSNSSKRR